MDTLPRDPTEEIGLKLSPADLINLCSTNTVYNRLLCNSDTFWLKKLRHDYPDEMREVGDLPIFNPKNIYMKRFVYVSEKIEAFMNKFIEIVWEPYGFDIYLNDRYKKDLYDALYKIYKTVITDYTVEDTIELDEINDIFYDFVSYLISPTGAEEGADGYARLHKYKVEMFKDFQRTPKIYEFL